MDRFLIDLILLPFSFAYIILLLKIASNFKQTGRMSGVTTRKFIHVTVGLIVIVMPLMFSKKLVPIFIATVFIFINLFTSPASPIKRFQLESTSEGHRLGTTYYSISLTLLLWLFFDTPWILQVGFLPLVVGDAAAAYFGSKYGTHQWKYFNDKSIEGSIFAFLSTFVILGVVLSIYKLINLFDFSNLFLIGLILVISLITSVIEMISPNGLDNLSIPLFCSTFAVMIS